MPYRDNLLNALVVEDWARAKKRGLTKTQALRVVAPGGVLCLATRKGWQVVTKPRPAGMDEWTHNYRNAGGNCGTSDDTVVAWPFGVRWNEDLPFNISNRAMSSHQWTNTRGLAVADGRVYYVTTCARENLKGTYRQMHASNEIHDQYLIARDAWNGAFLWRHKLGPIFYGNLHYSARAPLVAANGKVYAANKAKQLMEFDGKTGKRLRVLPTTFMPSILLVLDDVLVVSNWKNGDHVGELTGVVRRRLDNKIAKGSMVAYDLKTGKALWKNNTLATSMRAADGRVYIVSRQGRDEYAIDTMERERRRGKYKGYDRRDPKKMKEKFGLPPGRGQQDVVALDLRSGKAIWTTTDKMLKMSPADHIAIDVAGLTSVVVGKNVYSISRGFGATGNGSIVLDGATGKEKNRGGGGFASLQKGKVRFGGGTVCTPTIDVNEITTRNRSNQYTVGGKSQTFGAARGSCMFAAVPANGALYTPQTWCSCAPGVVPGFVSFGPIHTEPTTEQMLSGAKRFKGPAYGKQRPLAGDAGWPGYLGHAERSSCNDSAVLPATLAVKWDRQIAAPTGKSNPEVSWDESLQSIVTAPSVSGGLVFSADRNRHKLVACDAKTGKVAWEKILGGRITTPPTIYKGLCLVGATDGYVYAFDANKGKLAWKMRMGPEERRMISHAQLESPWSVFSSILVTKAGIAYASAGRTTAAEGGIVVRAFDPATGKIKWSQVIAYLKDGRRDHTDDVMFVHGKTLCLMKTLFDLETGQIVTSPLAAYEKERQNFNRQRHLANLAKAKAKKKGVAVDPKTQILPPEPKRPTGIPLQNQGIEGFANSNWTRLGNRRRRNSNLNGVSGMMLAWDSKLCVSGNEHGANGYDCTKTGQPKRTWGSNTNGTQVTALAMGSNAVAIAGGVYPAEGKGKVGGFVRIVSRDGKELAMLTLPAPVAYHGLAVAGDNIYVTLQNGMLLCLGAK